MNNAYRWLVQQSKPAKRWLFLSVSLGIFSGLLVILQSGLLATIIDHVYLQHATTKTVFFILLSLLFTIIFRAAISWFREIAAFKTAYVVKNTVRENILDYIAALQPAEVSKIKTGALTTTLIEQVEALHGFFADYFPQMTIVIILPLIILMIVFMQNWVAGFILLITAPLIPLFMALIGMQTAKLNQENFETLARMSAHFLDTLQGLTTLVLFHRAAAQTKSIAYSSEEFREKTMRILRVAFLSTAALELFGTVSIAMIAVYLGLGLLGLIHLGFQGVHITLQHALFILLLAPEFFMPLRQLGTFYHARAEAMGAATEILKILSVGVGVGEKIARQSEPFITRNIFLSLNDICFAYDEQKKIINRFNLTAHPGECVTIIGESGIGKTTLLNLIAKFLSPTSGSISANKMNLNDIDQDEWRNQFAFLQQHPRVFHGTIAENILLAKENATPEELEKAASDAGVLDFTNHLPDGLNTKVGEQGFGLSGGQIQRIALARIALKNAPLILLDEPTAHLDQKNKEVVVALLEKWKKENKTIVIATHDSEIRNGVGVGVK